MPIILAQFTVRLVNFALLFDWHHLCVGAWWTREIIYDDDSGGSWDERSVYLALLPMLPIRVVWDLYLPPKPGVPAPKRPNLQANRGTDLLAALLGRLGRATSTEAQDPPKKEF